MDAIRALLEKLGLHPLVVLIVLLILMLIGVIFSQNVGGVKTWFYRLTKTPDPPDTHRPLLKMKVETVPIWITFKGDLHPTNIVELVFSIENIGNDVAVNHPPYMKIEDQDEQILHNTSNYIKNPSISDKLLPASNVGWGMFRTLAKYSSDVIQGIQLFGLDSIMD